MDFNRADILKDQNTLKQIEAVCRKLFGQAAEADECFLYILEKCREDNCRRLGCFAGRSSLKTYLYTLCNNLAIDFKRAKFGRRRIPKMVRDMGAWAEVIYRLVCWQRYSYEDAWEIASLDGTYTDSFNRFLSDIEELGKAPCSENPHFFSIEAQDRPESLADPNVASNPLESLLKKLGRQKRLQAARIIRNHTGTLTAEDQLLIRLIYGDNHSMAGAGRLVGLQPMQAQRRLKKILRGFRESLLAQGITGL